MVHTSRESWVDSLNGRWTPLLFLILGVLAWVGQIYIRPIECNFPPEFSGSMLRYSSSRCYMETNLATTSLPMRDFGIPMLVSKSRDNRNNSNGERTLYQYVPLILILQALFLRIPYILWKLGQDKFGIHFTVSSTYGENSKAIGRKLAIFLDQWIKNRKITILSIGSMTIFHCFIKLLYFVSVSTQLGVLDPFLKAENQTSFGSQVLKNIRENNSSFFDPSPVFPRHVMCTYEIQLLSNTQKYTVQCVLPFNPYLEQIMALVWWWMIFLIAATIADGLVYFFGALMPFFRIWFVRSNLLKDDLADYNQAMTERNINRFANKTLGEDVVVFLKQTQDNDNGCVVMETVTELWRISHGDVPTSPVRVSTSRQQGTSETAHQTAPSITQTGSGQSHPEVSSLYPAYPQSSWENESKM